MNPFEETKRNNDIQKLVSNARAILSNQIGLPIGILKMERIANRINEVSPIEIDLSVFKSYNSQSSEYPIGVDRLGYNLEFLLKLDKELDNLTTLFKPMILEKCFEIIKQYSVNSR